ncbi:adenylyltransferase/cytidyltransferase family protein [Patescibacteria group bacterium]|nr:adenylyltransferase/cytidyltransferase family protein [Patescibacteria group bacterium]MBU1931266.1 adenylyltransferase/cytidyltransferase family protein [Patescibacteria group bacterium]
MADLDKQILKTLVYADLFTWPLTAKEINRFLISSRVVLVQLVSQALDKLVKAKKVDYQPPYYFLPGRQKNIVIRSQRQLISQQKIKRARQVVKLFGLIPFIKLISITGNVAVGNAAQPDDIDLMIIVQANTLWLTRPMATFLLELFGWRRRPKDKQAKDKFCLNLWLDETALKLPRSKQNLFTAHEIIQMQPILNRRQVYERFLQANQWIKQHLANSSWRAGNKPKTLRPAPYLLSWLNNWLYKIQLQYMCQRRTTEKIGLHYAFFHLNDNSQLVLRRYNKKAKTILITGCFDILHAEHRRLLRVAKKLGQLLVGVESDVRVRRLKGRDRPINSIKTRLKNLKNLDIADRVFELPAQFDSEADFLKLLRQLQPDVLAVSNSTPNLAVKRRLMKQIGGQVKIVLPYNPKISSTILLNKPR